MFIFTKVSSSRKRGSRNKTWIPFFKGMTMGVKKNELSDDTICVARYTLHVVYYLSWQTINRRYLHLIYLTSSKKLPGRHGRIPFD